MALTQVSSAGIKNAEVKTEDILDANITTAKIAADAVTGAKIADDAIGAEHIEDLDSHVKLLDNSQAIFGTGEDLKIYHNGSNSYIINSTGETWLRGNDVRIADTAGEWMGQFAQDAAVKLYYDNSKKFETTSTGTTTTGNATITGHIYQGDSDVHYFGAGPDLAIWHSGSHGFIRNTEGNLYIYSADGHDGHVVIQATYGEESIICEDNGTVKLYYDNSTKLETKSYGLSLHGNVLMTNADNQILKFGASNDLEIKHDGTNSYINNSSGDLYVQSTTGGDDLYLWSQDDIYIAPQNGEGGINLYGDGAVELYYDGTKKFETSSSGITMSGSISFSDNTSNIDLNDNNKLRLGSSADIEIYHNGTYSFIKNATGSLTLQSPGLIQLLNADASEYYIEAVENGAVSLYYDGSKKFETNNLGVTVTGGLWVTEDLALYDNKKLYIGDGNDLQIYHDGSNSYIKDAGTGQLDISSDKVWISGSNNESMATFTEDGAVDLYHNGSKVFETLGNGVRAQGGIMFGSDTADANRITDYEEGTFTAALTVDSGTNPSQNAYTHRYAYYRKIGKLVHFRVDIAVGAISQTGSGNTVLSGLPFANSNQSLAYGVTFSSGYSTSWGSNNFPTQAYIGVGSSEMHLMNNTVADGDSYVQAAYIVNGTRLICGGTYMTDS